MFNLREYRPKGKRLPDKLPWGGLIAPSVVLNKDGSLLSVIRFRGPDLDSSTETQLIGFRKRLNDHLRRFGTGWCFHFEQQQLESSQYPDSVFPDPVTQAIDNERRARFQTAGTYHEAERYLSLTYIAPSDIEQKAKRIVFDNATVGGAVNYEETLTQYQKTVAGLTDTLKSFMPLAEPLENDDLLTFLHSTVSDRPHRVVVPEVPFYLDVLLADSGLVPGIAPQLGRRHLKTLSVRGFVTHTTPALLDKLNSIPIEYRWVSRWIPLDKTDAKPLLERRRRDWFNRRTGIKALLKETITAQETKLHDPDATEKVDDIAEGLRQLGSDIASFGYFTITITVWGDSQAEAIKRLKVIEDATDDLGFVSVPEDLNAVEAWLGSLPGHAYADARRPLTSSITLCDLLPISAIWAGPSRSGHLDGPPLLTTSAGITTPYRLDLFQGDVGHTFISGPTGAGKSTLLGLLEAQFMRYPKARVTVFDKDRSSRAMTLGSGGSFWDLGIATAEPKFQPLRRVDEQQERIWASEWLIDVFQQEGLDPTPARKESIWTALRSLAAMDRPLRTLTTFKSLLQDNELRDALRPYTLEGAFGYILDGSEDTDFPSRWNTFEMAALMKAKSALVPTLNFLFHIIEATFDGSPHLLVLDEGWLFLDTPYFQERLREWLKTLRKRNVTVVFATQALADIQNSKIAPDILQACGTRIYLPDDDAMNPQTAPFYTGFGLNERQREKLQSATKKRDYYLTASRGNRMFQLDAGPLTLAFCASSTQEDHALMDAIDAPAGLPFARAFLAAKGLHHLLGALPDA